MSQRIARYDIEAEIGQGVLIRVFRACDRSTGRPVTLKLLTSGADRALAERFRREVSTVSRLRHGSIIAVYELGEHKGLPFAAMQRLGEDDLRSAIATGRRLSLLQKTRIMWQAAQGVLAAQREGLDYVGIRPSGIALDSEGSAIIQDFGVVRLTRPGDAEELAFQAPEEFGGAFAPDPLSEVFAFGAVYYQLLTGTHPFRGSGSGGTPANAVHGEPPPVRSLAPECPEALERLIHGALERNRELRCQSIDEFQYEVESIIYDLRHSRATALVAEAHRLADRDEVDKAQGILGEILEFDPDNHDAHRLRRMLTDQTRLHRRVDALLRQAKQEGEARDFEGAVELLESAHGLDPESSEVQKQLSEWLLRLEQSRKAAQLAGEARQLLEAGCLEEAQERASQALEADAGNADGTTVLRTVDEAISQKKAAVDRALDEAGFLIEQDRPDLALELLRTKSADLPDEPDLLSALAEVEQYLREWERRRLVQDCIRRINALIQLEQWSVALTVTEEALRSAPESQDLLQTAEQLRGRLHDEERRRKLVRRRDAIRQKIANKSWPEALALIESAEKEFPGEAELQHLRNEAEAGGRQAACDALVAEVRQCLADEDFDQAEEILRNATESLGDEPALKGLHEEVQEARHYREQWRLAQVLFGRREFQKAEGILLKLAAQNRPEAQALLETVRDARAANEEEAFYKTGREKALKLMAEEQYEQAADLLRNLLTLFPKDPILERDLQSARGACPAGQDTPPPAAAEDIGGAEPETVTAAAEPLPDPPPRKLPAFVKIRMKRGVRRRLVAAAGAFILVIFGGIAWHFSARASVPGQSVQAQVNKQLRVVRETVTRFSTAQLPVFQPDAASDSTTVKKSAAKHDRQTKRVLPQRSFTAPVLAKNALPAPVMLPPPAPVPAAPANTSVMPPPLPDSIAEPKVPVRPAQAAAPAPRSVSTVREAKLISHPTPLIPDLARQRGIHGEVSLVATVDKRGMVTAVRTVSGDPVLAMAAKSAVLKWRYQPATINGTPTDMTVPIKVVFEANR